MIRILILDDNPRIAEGLRKALTNEFRDDGEELSLEVCTNFDDAEAWLKRERFDLAVLDVRLDAHDGEPADPERGRALYERVCAVQWLPVVFYTAARAPVEHLEAVPLVSVVQKRRPADAVKAVRAGLASGLPQFTKRVGAELDQVLRAFIRDDVRPYWGSLSDEDREDIVPVLANRLSAFIKQRYLDDSHRDRPAPAHASAARFYLYPPVSETLSTGDVIREADERWFVVMTPACDLVENGGRSRKAQFLRIAAAIPIGDSEPAKAGKGKLQGALGKERYFLLPAFRSLPDLLVDFERIETVDFSDFDERDFERIATVDSPFCEAMLSRFGRFVSRIGFEDLPTEHLLDKAVEASGAKPT